MAKTLLFGGVLGQFHPCEHEQQALWLGLATGGVQEIPEIGAAHAACVMVIGAKLARTTSEGGRASVAPCVRMERSGAGRGDEECRRLHSRRHRLPAALSLATLRNAFGEGRRVSFSV